MTTAPAQNGNAVDLASIFTPDIFKDLVDLFLPWPASEAPEASAPRDLYYYPSSTLPASITSLCASRVFGPLLAAESSLTDTPPQQLDLLQYLPPPESPSFPQQALGFILLLDAAPRFAASSSIPDINLPYLTHTILPPLSKRLTHLLFTLPLSHRPDDPARWLAQSYTYAHTALARLHFYAPLAHSSDFSDQLLAGGFYDSLRRDTEAYYGVRDPTRRSDAAIAGDVDALVRLKKQGPPPCGGKDMHTFIYWSAMVGRAHSAVVRVEGKLPGGEGKGGEGKEKENGQVVQEKRQNYSACG